MTPTFFRSLPHTLFRRHARRLPALLAFFAGAFAFFGAPAPCHAELRMFNLWWAPEAVTEGGHRIDELLMIIFWLTTAVFIITQVVYVYFIVKYRHRKGMKAVYSHGNNKLEIIWTTIPAAIFILLAVVSDKLWFELRSAAPKDAVNIDIVAYQFGFHIRNPGSDGRLGSYDQDFITKGDNNFGVVATDPSGNDDYQSENQLTLPVGKPVNVILRSQDVIHAFYVPEFRMYQDIVPGMTINWVWFTPEKIGHYALACNQLCGNGHFNMQAKIDVVSQEDYAKLVKEKSDAALKAHADKEAKTAGGQNGPAPAIAALSP